MSGHSEDNKLGATDIPNEVLGPERTLLQMFKFYVEPEIERRRSGRLLTEPFILARAQVLFFEGRSPEVRLNDEVKIALLVRAPRAVQKGEAVSLSEIEHIEGSELDLADSDAGHFTAVLLNNNWLMFFDFRRNKRKASALVKRAEEFCAMAEHALSERFAGPWVDNLYSACELLAKARLITSSAESSDVKSHGRIHSEINRWGLLGNVDRKFVETLNKLSNLPTSARYKGDDISQHVSPEMVATARAEISELKIRLKRFSPDEV
jgi:HEPN domain-containing protein